MAELKRVNFYGRKPPGLPRFVYRRLGRALQDPAADREAAISAALAECLGGTDPDIRKFKFTLPDFLRKILTTDEAARFESETAARRARAAQLKLVFPHVSDEFSLRPEFLASVLDMEH